LKDRTFYEIIVLFRILLITFIILLTRLDRSCYNASSGAASVEYPPLGHSDDPLELCDEDDLDHEEMMLLWEEEVLLKELLDRPGRGHMIPGKTRLPNLVLKPAGSQEQELTIIRGHKTVMLKYIGITPSEFDIYLELFTPANTKAGVKSSK
jgi:hypothetical protein